MNFGKILSFLRESAVASALVALVVAAAMAFGLEKYADAGPAGVAFSLLAGAVVRIWLGVRTWDVSRVGVRHRWPAEKAELLGVAKFVAAAFGLAGAGIYGVATASTVLGCVVTFVLVSVASYAAAFLCVWMIDKVMKALGAGQKPPLFALLVATLWFAAPHFDRTPYSVLERPPRLCLAA